jgi:hypothetical protein
MRSESSDSRSFFNLDRHSPSTPLVLHLPAFPITKEVPAAAPPDFLQDWPVASINYRWADELCDGVALRWPTPVHDIAFAYAWILKELMPPVSCRQKILAYGSYLGASLALSLALTESQPHTRFGLKGVVAHNGIYNWTMFLADHPIHKRKKTQKKTIEKLGPLLPLVNGRDLETLHEMMPGLFGKPSDAFDPFASPSLFFHNPGLHVPATFHASSMDQPIYDMVTSFVDRDFEKLDSTPPKAPRKSHLVFPPRDSTLKIPESLVLFDAGPQAAARGKRAASKPQGHTLGAQAEELVELMRRSVDKVELKERRNWDENIDALDNESARRVQIRELEPAANPGGLSQSGQYQVISWLKDQSK